MTDLERFIFIILSLGAITGLLFLSVPSYGEEIPEDVAIHCIQGEARQQFTEFGYEAFLSMAEALRNRGTIKGVYGCKERWGRTPAEYATDVKWMERYNATQEARRAWREARYSNLVNGATHWEGAGFKDPYWVKGMVKTATIAGTHFYREKS